MKRNLMDFNIYMADGLLEDYIDLIFKCLLRYFRLIYILFSIDV